LILAQTTQIIHTSIGGGQAGATVVAANATQSGGESQATGEGSSSGASQATAGDSSSGGESGGAQTVVVQPGTYSTESGGVVQVAAQANDAIEVTAGNVSAQTTMEMVQEQAENKTKLKVKLSNGMYSEVKVMPDTASETAIESLSANVCSVENGCVIELKEVGNEQQQPTAAYEVQIERHARILGIFETKMQVRSQVDAESGEVIRTERPWWAFLAVESED
jgi:hypothetical protein